MEANAVAGTLIKDYGKKWYYITPDYAFGHTLQAGMEKASAKLGGSSVGGDLTPLGTTDFSSYLIKAQAAKPDIIIFLVQGDDMAGHLHRPGRSALHRRQSFRHQRRSHLGADQLPGGERIVLPASTWFSLKFGRKRFLITCIIIFTSPRSPAARPPTWG